MLTYRPDTPEARLALLLDLAERASRIDTNDAALTAALDEVEQSLATQLRVAAANLNKPQSAQPPRDFKVGDRVRVARITCSDDTIDQEQIGTVGVIVSHDPTGQGEGARMCWQVRPDGSRLWGGWHASDELEHVD